VRTQANECDSILAQLRAEGFSPIDSIKVTRAVLHVSLGEAKRIVHCRVRDDAERTE
jgi:ribosomal protein L7/L12